MQRSEQSAIVSGVGTPIDANLLKIKDALACSYWYNPNQGVFSFQFLSENMPLTNRISPHVFHLVRYTPDYNYDSFQTTIQGRLNSDGTFEYGGGQIGTLTSLELISWSDKTIWRKTDSMTPREEDPLNLKMITEQAKLDSMILMGKIYQYNYLY